MNSITRTKAVKQLLVCFCSLFLVGTLSAQATKVFDVRFTYPRPCVLGTVDAKGMLEIYVNTGADISMQNITLLIDLPAGVSIPDTNADVTFNPDAVQASSLEKSNARITPDGKLRIYIPGQAAAPAVLKNSADQLLVTVYFTMGDALAGTTVNMPFTVQALVGNDGANTIVKDNYLDEAPANVTIPVFTKREVADGRLFIQKGAETSKVYTLESTGGDAGKQVTYELVGANGGAAKGTVTIAGNKATYTVTDANTEFFDADADTFQFTASDATTGTSAPATVTVSYRANPPAVITALDGQPALGGTITIPEVDDAGNASAFTLGINATDDPIVAPNGVAKIEWIVALGDETNAWTVDVPISEYNPALESQDCQVTITLPGYDTITGSPRPQSKDFTVTVTVTDVLGATSSASWTVKVTDVDRPQGAPQRINGFNPAAPKTADDITVIYTPSGRPDADGDAISYRVTWTCGDKRHVGETLPNAMTLKGETWTAAVVSVTAPYGADVVSEAASDMVIIGNTAPVVADGSMFIRKGAETEKTFTLSATDVDPADVFAFAVVKAPDKGNVVIVGNVATYTVTDPNVEFYGDAADTFTFVANDGTDDSNVATVTVTYRENPPADIAALPEYPALGSVVEVPEVDADGNPSVFALGINATDSDVAKPYGVKKITWEVNGLGWTISAPSTDYANIPSQDSIVNITLPGYETINGAGRPASQDFTVTVTVWDAMDVESSETWTIRVLDVDRPASAPDTLDILVDGTAIADGGTAKVAQVITLNADGSVDPDGDVVTGYDFTWINDKNGSTDIAERAKGETWTVTAKAKTIVYGNETISTEGSQKSVLFVNTPPVLALADPLPWTDDNALLEDCATTMRPLADFVAVHDDDAADLEAARSYTVTFAQLEDGSLTYDPTEKTVAFTPTENFFGDVTFTVIANDGTDDSAPLDVTFTVLPVNDPPVVAVADFYAIPDDCTGQPADLIFIASMGGGKWEEDQVLVLRGALGTKITDVTDEAGILNGWPTIAVDGHTVIVTYTLLESAKDKMGAEAIISFTVQDDGGVANGGVDTSAETTFKIVLGATPWYPLYELTDAKLAENPAFAAYTSYVVRIKDGGTVLAQNTLKDGDRIFSPAKYFTSDVACDGLLPSATVGENRQYTVEILPRDKNGVVNDPAKVLRDTVQVPYYSAPTAASFTGVNVAGNTVTFDINAPLASNYTLKVYTNLVGGPRTLVFERNAVKFQPRMDGMIIPVTLVKGEFLTAGDYVAVLSSANPVGPSVEVLAEATFTIDAAGQSELEWPWPMVGFSPEQSLQAVGATVNPQFVWPDIGAAGYELWVTDALGQAVVAGVPVEGTSYNGARLNAGETYTWWVVAVGADGQKLRSSALSLAIMSKADTPLVVTATAGAGSLTLAINPALLPDARATYYYDLEYVSVATARFYYFKYALDNAPPFVWNPAPVPAGLAPTHVINLPGVPVQAGDYVFIRVMDAQGQALSDYILYEVVAAD
ncbi:MAG: Ig-like domain-containing protein [Lentisphaeria bacterium]|jgi:hypothetical protein